MKFLFIVLIIYFYFTTQTVIDARTAGLRKAYSSFFENGDYANELIHKKFSEKRQAGWGKRHGPITEYENDDISPNHPYTSYENSARTWFDDR